VKLFGIVIALAVAASSQAAAQPAKHKPAAPNAGKNGEAEFLVPPQGSAVDVPIHKGVAVVLSFPEKLDSSVLGSSPDYEISRWGDDAVGVLAKVATAHPASLALATASGSIKVNVTIHVVPDAANGLTLVRFKAATAEAAFNAAVDAEVTKRMAALDAKVRDHADAEVAGRVLRRLEVTHLKAIERNDDNVVVRVQRAVFLGDDAYLVFEIENRSGDPYRLSRVQVLAPNGGDHARTVRMASTAVVAPDPSVVGVVPGGGRGQGVVVLREVDGLLGKPLKFIVEQPHGRGRVVVDRGVTLR